MKSVLESNYQEASRPYSQNELNQLNLCELFLTKDDITKIELIAKFKFNPTKIKCPNDLLIYLISNDYPIDINKYIEDNIFIEFECS